MDEVKKDTGETKVEESTPVAEEPKKKKGGKTVLIIVLVLVGILLLCGLGGYFGLRAYIADLFEEVEDAVEVVDEEVDESVDFFIPDVEEDEPSFEDGEEELESDLPKVEDDMEDADLVSDRFPEDIPLSGGKVTSSSFDQWGVKVDLQTSSSVEDAYTWYEEALEDTDWVVTSKSRDDTSASIDFNNGEERRSDDYRSGSVRINRYEWRDYAQITVRETY